MQSVLQICSGTEWEFDMKKKLIQATCLFFVMMLIFTILSRVSDSVNVIQIQTKNPANQMITHEVKGSGKVEGSQEVAVFVLENLQVEQVMVHAGQTVKKGDILLNSGRAGKGSGKPEKGEQPEACSGADMGWKFL